VEAERVIAEASSEWTAEAQWHSIKSIYVEEQAQSQEEKKRSA
jgi:hypothetical protein